MFGRRVRARGLRPELVRGALPQAAPQRVGRRCRAHPRIARPAVRRLHARHRHRSRGPGTARGRVLGGERGAGSVVVWAATSEAERRMSHEHPDDEALREAGEAYAKTPEARLLAAVVGTGKTDP